MKAKLVLWYASVVVSVAFVSAVLLALFDGIGLMLTGHGGDTTTFKLLLSGLPLGIALLAPAAILVWAFSYALSGRPE